MARSSKQMTCKLIAAYKGDTFKCVGTYEEVAEHLGVTVDTVKFYCSPIHHKRKGENGLKCYRIEEEKQ